MMCSVSRARVMQAATCPTTQCHRRQARRRARRQARHRCHPASRCLRPRARRQARRQAPRHCLPATRTLRRQARRQSRHCTRRQSLHQARLGIRRQARRPIRRHTRRHTRRLLWGEIHGCSCWTISNTTASPCLHMLPLWRTGRSHSCKQLTWVELASGAIQKGLAAPCGNSAAVGTVGPSSS